MSAAQDLPEIGPPPVVTFPSVLPFEKLDWEPFELLCLEIALAAGYMDVRRYGRRGQKQDGIDFHGRDSNGQRTAWQCKCVSSFGAAELRSAVLDFANGPRGRRYATFVICIACEGNDRNLDGELAILRKRYEFGIELWESTWLTHELNDLPNLVYRYFGEVWAKGFNAPSVPNDRRLNADALLFGPIEAEGLSSMVEEAERVKESSPADAVRLYGEIEGKLRERFPRHADRFREKRAFALIDAVGPEAGHDEFMQLAVQDLFDRGKPELSPEVSRGLAKLRDQVDPVRRSRGEALFHFRWTHEDPEAISDLADCFGALPFDDQYAPHIAVLLAEVAVATRDHRIVNDRRPRIQQTTELADGDLALRLRVALADVDEAESWLSLIAEAQEQRFRPREATFVCMRAARWSVWNGDSKRAESLYRQAMRFGADAGLDLDVKNALRSLLSLYGPTDRYDDFVEAHQLMLAIDGSDSFIPLDSQTARYSYQNLATEELPEAHLLSRYRVLEGVRSGCFSVEIEAHAVLARVYLESDEPMDALKHAVLGGDQELTKRAATRIDKWPESLSSMVDTAAPWVLQAALLAVEQLGDLAPPQVATTLAQHLTRKILADHDDPETTRPLYEALSAVVLEATDDDIEELMPLMNQAVAREPEEFRWTDPGVVAVAVGLYRFRPRWREQAAEILAERLIGPKISDWWKGLRECGAEIETLAVAIERTAARTGVNLDEALAELGYLSESTRTFWSDRLSYVEAHLAGPLKSQTLGDDFGVPRQFLEEQTPETTSRYVTNLVAIAKSPRVVAVNRGGALLAGGNVVDMLPLDLRTRLFEEARPLVEPNVELSDHDRHSSDTDHALSRVRIRTSGATRLRLGAAWFLGRSAANAEQRAIAIALAKEWLLSDMQRLQQQAALLLSQPNLTGHGVHAAQLAKHPNAMVRRMAPFMPDLVEVPDAQLARDLATDPSRNVRLTVIDVLPSFEPEARQELLSILAEDWSALVRHSAANAVSDGQQS